MYDGAKEISDFEKIPMSEIGSQAEIPGGDDDFMDGLEDLGIGKQPRGTINFDDDPMENMEVQSNKQMKIQNKLMQD